MRRLAVATSVAFIAMLGLLAMSSAAHAETVFPVSGITSNTQENSNPLINLIDDRIDTRFAPFNPAPTVTEQYVEFDLGVPRTVDAFKIAMFNGHQRDWPIQILAGNSPNPGTSIFTGQLGTVANNGDFATVTFPETTARYFRVRPTGNDILQNNNFFGGFEAQLVDSDGAPFEPEACTYEYSDYFEGNSLDEDKWSRHTRNGGTPSNATTVANGVLDMPTGNGELDAGEMGPVNFIGVDFNDLVTRFGGTWMAETEATIDFPATAGWPHVGIAIWQSDQNFFRATATQEANTGRIYTELSRDNPNGGEGTRSTSSWPGNTILPNGSAPVEVRIKMRFYGTPSGDTVNAAYSLYNPDTNQWGPWTAHGTGLTGGLTLNTSPRRDSAGTMLGLFAGGNLSGAPLRAEVEWDYFRTVPAAINDCEEPNSAPVIDSVTATPDSGDAPLEVDFAVQATDADNDDLEYEWDFDDGSPTSDEEDPTHVFTDPGEYEVSVTVSDGTDSASDTVTVTVDEPTAQLDLGRKVPVKGLTVGSQEVRTGTSGSHNPAASLIDGNFSTRWATNNTGTGSANDWFEFDLGSSQTIDTLAVWFEMPLATYPIQVFAGDTSNPGASVFTGSVEAPADKFTPTVVEFDNPVSARYVRVVFTDVWQAAPGQPWTGDGQWFSAFEAAVFNSAQAAQSCVPVRSDEFNGNTLNESGKWQRHSTTPANAFELDNGRADTVTGANELDAGTGTGPVNMIGQDLAGWTTAATHSGGAVNWVVETEFTLKFNATANPYGWPHVGLIVWQSDGNFFRYTLSRNDTNGSIYVEGSKDNPTNNRVQTQGNPTIIGNGANQPPVRIQMRFVRPNTNVVAAQHRVYNTQTQQWGSWSNPIATGGSQNFRIAEGLTLATTPRRDSAGSRIGIIAGGTLSATTSPAADVSIEYFRVAPDEYTDCVADNSNPVTTPNVSPAPDGQNGWYTEGPVTVSLSASDTPDNNSRVSTRRQVNTGAWDEYAQAHQFTTDGAHTYSFRSEDAAGNLEGTKSVSVNIDSVAPTVDHELDPSDGPYQAPAGVELTLDATDATSGVDTIEYSDDGGDTWTEYTDPVAFTAVGNYEITYRATDVAGNVSDEEVVDFEVESGGPKKVLIYTGTTGYRHGGSGTINNSTQAIHTTVIGLIQDQLEEIGIESDWEDCNGYTIPPTVPTNTSHCNHPDKNARIFAPSNLEQYDALYFMNTSSKWSGGNASQQQGQLFSADDRAAIIDFVNNGGGIAANHNAVDMGAGQMSWNWWDAPAGRSAVTSLMPGHAATNATGNLAPFILEDNSHPAGQGLNLPWNVGDEHYNFSTVQRPFAHVIATFDESAAGYNPGGNAMGADHPISWCKPYDGGRVFLSGIGHFAIRYTEGTPAGNNNLMKHLVGGIGWVTGVLGDEDDCDYPDITAPLTTHTLSPASPDGSAGWYRTKPTISLSPADDSGYTPAAGLVTESRIGAGGSFDEYDEPFEINAEGNGVVVQYRTTDAANNVEATKSTAALNIDTVAPTVNHSLSPASGPYSEPTGVTLTLNASDATSGVGQVQYSIDGGDNWTNYTSPVAFTSAGEYEVSYRATDVAGNVSNVGEVDFDVEGEDAEPCVQISDEFNGTSLDEDKWLRHTRNGGTPDDGSDKALWLADGKLHLPTHDRELDGATVNANGPINFVGQDLSEWGDAWTAETEISIQHNGGWQHVGLIVWQADNNFFRSTITNSLSASQRTIYVEQSKDTPGGTGNEGTRTTAGGNVNIQVGGTPAPIRIGMRYTKTAGNNTVQGQYRIFNSGTDTWGNWTNFPATSSGWNNSGGLNLAPSGAPRLDSAGSRIGIIAAGNFPGEAGNNPYNGTPAVAEVEYFRVTPDADCEAPVTTHELDPETPDAPGGKYMPGVTLSLSATDNVSAPGDITTQYSTNGGANWQTYTSPIEFTTAGTHTVHYRSTDEAGNVETAKQVTIEVADTSTCDAYSDEFNGAVLDDKWWRHTRNGGTPANSTVLGGGKLKMLSGQYEIDTDNATTGVGPVTFIGQDLNAITQEVGTTWEVETQFTVHFKTTASPHGWQHVGLMVWNGTDVTGPDNNHFRFGITRNNDNGHIYAQGSRDIPGGTANEGSRQASSNDLVVRPNANTQDPVTVRLRLTRTGGDLVTGSISIYDDSTDTWGAWTTMANANSGSQWRQGGGGLNLAPSGAPRLDAPGGKIGLIAGGNFNASAPAEMDVEYFKVTPDGEVPCPPADEIAPESSHSLNPAVPGSGWYGAAPTVTLSATDDFSGVNRIEYRIGTTGPWLTYSTPFQVNGQGANIVQYRAIDNNGNVEEPNQVAVNVDTVAPVVNYELDPSEPDGPGGIWWEPGVQLGFEAADASSGVDTIEYSTDGGYMFVPYNPAAKPTFNDDGVYEVQFRATDVAGNVSDLGTVTFNVGASTAPDTTAPVTTSAVNPAVPSGENGWYNTKPVGLTLSAIDAGPGATGVASTKVRIGEGGDFDEYNSALSLSTEGVHDVQFFSEDNAGNAENVKTTTVKIDTIKPNSNANLNPAYPGAGGTYGSAVSFSFSATDATSGVNGIEYRVNGGQFQAYGGGQVTISAEGEYLVEFRAIDNAGNVEDTDSIGFTIDNDEVVVPPVIPVPIGDVDAPFPLNLNIDPSVGAVQYSVEYSADNGATWTTHTAWTPYTGTVTFTTPGKYKFHYRWEVGDGWSSINTLPFTVKGKVPAPVALNVSVTPKSKSLKANKTVTLKVKVTNSGIQAANNVKVCAKAPSKKAKINGAKCQTIDTLGAGASTTLKFKVKKTAKGKSAKVKFTITSPDASKKTASAKLKLKK